MKKCWFACTLLAASLIQIAPAQSASPRFASTSPGDRLANLDTLKARLKQYHDCTSGCYAHDLDAQAAKAMAFLAQRARRVARGQQLALVLDIDETTLSNYEEMSHADFAYDPKSFSAWEKEARAPAIAGTLKLFEQARKEGVAVFFLTGRPEGERADTERDLRAAGFNGWQRLILRSPAEAHLSAQQYKSAERAAIAKAGYRIVLNVGDQWSDLRGTPEAEYSVKYPNPYYFIP